VTPLGNISTNHLALTCGLCGHTSLVSVLSLIKKLGKDMRVDEVIPKARCGHCKAKGKATHVITYVGGSGEAMLGAEQQD
jgi:hypothetical protein